MESGDARATVVLAALRKEPTSTSDLYDRVGYPALARVGLIPYGAFRDQLVRLSALGLAESTTGEDGTTLWRRRRGGPAEDEGDGERSASG